MAADGARVVGRYLTRLVAARTLGCLLGLAAVLQLLDLLDRLGDILARGTLADVWHYEALRLPVILAEMLPLAVLLGAVLAFRQLAIGLEATALRSAGLSLAWLLRALLPFCAVVAALQFGLRAEVAPLAQRDMAAWWEARFPAPGPPARLWLRTGEDVVAADGIAAGGRRLAGVMIVRRAADGDLLERLDATEARYRHGAWTLYNVREARPGQDLADRAAVLPWAGLPAPANLVELALPLGDLPAGELLATLRGRWIGIGGPAYYWTELQQLLAGLAEPLLMVMLALPVLAAPPRRGLGLATAVGIGLGLGYIVSAGLLAALGDAALLRPWVAGWMAPIGFFWVAVARLRRLEG